MDIKIVDSALQENTEKSDWNFSLGKESSLKFTHASNYRSLDHFLSDKAPINKLVALVSVISVR